MLNFVQRSRMWAMSKDPAVQAAANLKSKGRQPEQPAVQQRRQQRAHQATQQMQQAVRTHAHTPATAHTHLHEQ